MKRVPILLLVTFAFVVVGFSQTSLPCKPPEVVFNKNPLNIFSEEQEMYLGEVMAETLDKNFLVLNDPVATAYLQQIGDRLVRHLPPSNIKFKFFLVDAPELNAFNIAGGRIYVTRKLVSFVKSEDELAGILGHELGHGIVRHHSTDMSKWFKELLGTDKVGDRQDVFEKFNQVIDRQRTKRLKQRKGHEGDQQLEADRIGLFAMIAAGYDPNAYITAWERMTETKGKTGSAIGDFFGTTRPEEKRLREMLKALGSLPSECLDRQAVSAGQSFSNWQSYVVSIAKVRYKEKFRGLVARGELKPALRGTIRHFQFSPDGKYIIAQDASGVNVLQRQPFAFLFRLNVDDAKLAHFSPDSKNLVLQTYGLRIEVWNVESRKPVLARELYVRDGCIQTAISPDGKTMVCYTLRGGLDLIDVETNEKIFSRKDFYIPSFFEVFSWQAGINESSRREIDALEMEFSPDSRYFLGGRVFRFSLGAINPYFGIFGFRNDQEAYIAYDLRERKQLKLPASLKNIVSAPFAFYSNDRIIGQHRTDPEKSGIFTFPEGERVEKFFLSANSYEKPFSGDYILVRPTKTNPVGVYSIAQKKFLLSNKSPAMDGYGDVFVSENTDGVIDLVRLAGDKFTTEGSVTLPRTDLGDVKAVAVSDEMDKLALSESARGGVWDLRTGEIKIHIRGFKGAFVDQNGGVYADFPPADDEKRMIAQLDAASGTAAALEPITTRGTTQYGRLLVRRKTKFDDDIEKRDKQRKGKDTITVEESDLGNAVVTTVAIGPVESFSDFGRLTFPDTTLEVSDAITRKPLWSVRYENEAPVYDVYPDADTVTLYWRLQTKSAAEILKTNPEIASKARAMGEKDGDYLVQVLNATTGAQIGVALIETGEGSFRIVRARAVGDWLTIIDSENRILFYSLSSGELRGRAFGHSVVVNPSKAIAIVENISGVLSVVDLNTGRRIDELRFPSEISYATFNKQGEKLFVLTANQRYYVFNAAEFRQP